MFTGTQCDLWSRPVGTGHEKSKSREIPSTYFYTLIPSLHEHEASGGGHGRCLYCRLTSFSRSLQTILRINLDGTVLGASTLWMSWRIPPDVNSGGTFRNFPPLLSHVCPAALSFDGYHFAKVG